MTGGPSTLGFIGLGVMGGRMCRNLARRSGRPIVGYGHLYSPVIYRLLER